MKTRQHPFNHSSLIWLVSFILLLQISVGDSGRGSMSPWRNLRQTELTLTTSDQKSAKKSHSLFKDIAKQGTRFTDDLSFNTRSFKHTQFANLKWKMSVKHVLNSQIKFVAVKFAENDDEDLSVLKG